MNELQNLFAAADTFKPRPELLLMDRLPRPLWGLAPRVVLGDAWWDLTRKAAYKSAGNRCAACGVPAALAKELQRLEGHEVYDVDYARGRSVYRETVPLCHYCHNFIHDGRMAILAAKNKFPRDKFARVMQHGRAVLKAAGLDPATRDRPVTKFAPAARWRLIVFGKAYSPLKTPPKEWGD